MKNVIFAVLFAFVAFIMGCASKERHHTVKSPSGQPLATYDYTKSMGHEAETSSETVTPGGGFGYGGYGYGYGPTYGGARGNIPGGRGSTIIPDLSGGGYGYSYGVPGGVGAAPPSGDYVTREEYNNDQKNVGDAVAREKARIDALEKKKKK